MRKFVLCICFLIILLFPLLAYSQPPTAQIVPLRDKLLNGLPVIILPRASSGSIAIHIVIKSGSTFDLINKAGLADLTSQMISRGTSDFTNEQFREELEYIGAKLEIVTYWDSTEIRMLGSSGKLESMLKLLNQMLTQPKFPQAEVDQLKAERLKELEAAQNATNATEESFYSVLYGKHPYGHNIQGTKESINKITRGDILDFYNRLYLANNSVLIIAGDITAERVLPEIKRGLGGWRKGTVPPYTFAPPVVQTGLNIKIKDLPTSDNAEIRLGFFALKKTEPSYLAIKLLTTVVNQRLAKHPEWKAQANLDARKLIGTFVIDASVNNLTTADTIVAMVDEIKKLTSITPEELQKAKDGLVQEYYENVNSNTELASRWVEIENYNLGSNYIKEISLILSRISLENLQEVAKKYLSTENLTVIVGGKVTELENNLKKLGKVEILTDSPPKKAETQIPQPGKAEPLKK